MSPSRSEKAQILKEEKQRYHDLALLNCENIQQTADNTKRAAIYLAAIHKQLETPAIIRFFRYWFKNA